MIFDNSYWLSVIRANVAQVEEAIRVIPQMVGNTAYDAIVPLLEQGSLSSLMIIREAVGKIDPADATPEFIAEYRAIMPTENQLNNWTQFFITGE